MSAAAAAARTARRPATLFLALVLLLTALVLPNVAAQAGPDETFADDFQSYSFGGSTGSVPWTGPWVESGESDGVGAGSIQVKNEGQCADDACLVLGHDAGPDATVEREADLSSYASATLTFDYKVHRHSPYVGSAAVKVSDDGGGSWVTLDTWPLGTNTSDEVGSYDISPYLAPDTRILFAVAGSSSDAHMNIDNLVITASDSWYLKGDGVPLASLGGVPTQDTLPNYDPGRDSEAGLYLQRSSAGLIAETDTAKHQWWIAPGRGEVLDGPITLTLWSAVQDFTTGARGHIDAGLFDCLPNGSACNLITTAQLDLSDWSSGIADWVERNIDFGPVTTTVADGRSLAVKIVVASDSDDDMLFAYDTVTYPSRLDTDANQAPAFDQDLLDRSDSENAVISLPSPATDPDVGDNLTYAATGLPPGLSIAPNTGLISGTIDFVAAAGSPYSVEITVIDDGAPVRQDTDTFAWTVLDTNRPPSFDQDLLDRSDPEGAAVSIPAPATDPDGGDLLTYSGTGLPEGISIDPASGDIAGVLGPNAAGTHAVTITVSDDGSPALQANDVFIWTVTAGDVTYLVANTGGANGGDDLLTVVDRTNPDPATNETNIGTGTGTTNIEGAALQPGTNVLFAIENDHLGTIDITTGTFAPRPSIAGAGNGSVGLIAFNNIESLTFNPFSGELFASHRRALGEEDLLLRLDPLTGSHISGAFGGDDYIAIESQFPYHHASDLAFDPTDGQLYLVHWDLTGYWSLATVDPESGATATKGPTPDDIVSLAFDEAGRLYTSTETGGAETLYELDKTDGSLVSAIVIDNGSNYEAMAIAFPVDPNKPPLFGQDLLDRTDPESTTIALSAAATDPDVGDNLTYSATSLPPGLSIDPGTGLISGTISFASTGVYAVKVVVIDDGIPNLIATDTFTWTVSEMNQTPVFDQDLLDRSDAEGSVISLAASATDPDGGDVLTYGATGLPPGLSIDTGSGSISGTIDYDASATSPYSVTLTATDNGTPNLSAVPDTFIWTVTNTNRPPVATNPGPQTTPELALFSIGVTATDPDGTVPTVGDGGTLPAWAVITDHGDGTATIAGTPGGGDSGTTTVTVTASDGTLTDDVVFDLTVTNTNQPPTITDPGNQTVAEGASLNLSIAGADPDGTTVGFVDSGTLPAWATLTDNGDSTGSITGTPSFGDSGTTTVTITVSDGSLSADAIFDIIVTNTNRPPVVNPIADVTVAEAAALIPVVVTATDPDGTTPSLTATGHPAWATFTDNGDGTATITGTPGYDDAATTTVTINANDGTLTGAGTFDIIVTNTNRPPVVNPIADVTVAEAAALIPVVVTATDPDGTTPSLAATGLPAWATFTDNGDGTATITGTPGYDDAATTTVTINANDGTLTGAGTFDIIVTNTNRPPVVNPIADVTVAEAAALIPVVVTATDPDGTTPSLAATGLPAWATFTDNGDGTATITGTPGYDDAATTTVTINANDGTLTGAGTFDIIVTNTNRPPVVNPIANATVAEASPLTPVVVTATDPDGTTPSLAATGLPAWATFTDNGDGTGTITGTPGYGDAAMTAVTINASDGSLTGSSSFDLTVTDSNQPPAFDSNLGNRTDAEGASILLAAGATDPDGDSLSYSASGLPPGLSIDVGSGGISGTITYDAAGDHAVQITVTDNGDPALSATDSFVWSVLDTNQAPKLDPIPGVLGAEETTITFTAIAADPDGDNVAFALAGAPSGAVIDPATGAFSWTPGEVHGTGSYPVTVTATDDGTPALSDSVVVTITVTEVNRAPTILPMTDQHSNEGDVVSVAIGATDPDIPTNSITYVASGLPPGLSINPTTGFITGTIGLDADGEHTVTVVTTDDGSPAASTIGSFTWMVGDTNRPPILDPLAPIHGGEQSIITFNANATDPDGDDLVFTMSGTPDGASIDPELGTFAWRPTESQGPGTYTFSVIVRDNGEPQLGAARTVTISVSEVNEAPTIEAIGDRADDEGAAIVLAVFAADSDLPANTLLYSATGLPDGITIDPVTGIISGTIAAGAEPIAHQEVTITVTDDGAPSQQATATFTWTVIAADTEPTNFPPSIDAIADQYSDLGAVIELRVRATDAESIVYSATGLPPGLTINRATGAIIGSLGDAAVGTHDVVVTVADSGSPPLASAVGFSWTITDRAAADDKIDLVVALDGAPDPESVEEDTATGRPVRRGLVVMSSAAAATSESMRLPMALLLALMAGFATIGRIGLYPLLVRGERHIGTISLYDEELGFGLVQPDGGGEPIFVHAHAFPRRQRAGLTVGTRIRYRLLASDNRASAWGATMENVSE